ncbi:hypothetical protein [Candidatus Poseidonia alphae]|uniref:hypothetical protein n=1 Tax=Candidatus Poseidonia alphae TaxID=1915863 RepID=UPI0030C69CB1
MRWRFSLPFLLATLMILPVTPAHGFQDETDVDLPGALLDIRVFSADCLTNSSCDLHQPAHLLEYFSADWCEPCEQVSQQVNALNETEALIIQHHPSNQDLTFLSESKLRFDQEYRLLLYPSLVVNGKHLLTGTRQAMDLNSTLENSTMNWSGLESMTVGNGTIDWNASAGDVLRIWYIEPTPHTSENRIHPHLARESWELNSSTLSYNLSQFETTRNGSFAVMLERPGVRNLTVSSDAPTGRVEIDGAITDVGSEGQRWNPAWLAVAAAAGLAIMLLPALFMHRRLMNKSPLKQFFESE